MTANRRRDILRRAAELFARQGVARTSMEDIAAAVGIKREGIYYYFKNRSDILLEIILPQSRSLLLSLQRIMRSNESSMEKLQAAIEVHLDAFNPSYIEMSVALKEQHFDLDDDRMNELRTVWDSYGNLWSDLIRAGQQRGEFNSDIDPRITAYGLLGMCNWVSRWYDPDKSITIKDITRTFSIVASTGVAQQ
jgi:AcrR family transcriptional regulator